MKRPEKNEYAEYYEAYVSLVDETDIVTALESQITDLQNLFAVIPEEQGSYAYAEGKWSIKQLVGHLIDGERIFSYRALRFARSDQTPLESFDQDFYTENADFNSVKLADLVEELILLRKANVLFFKNLLPEDWNRTGIASNSEVSVRALAYIIGGHLRHHLRILKERYLSE